jgi:hypothetical protein
MVWEIEKMKLARTQPQQAIPVRMLIPHLLCALFMERLRSEWTFVSAFAPYTAAYPFH